MLKGRGRNCKNFLRAYRKGKLEPVNRSRRVPARGLVQAFAVGDITLDESPCQAVPARSVRSPSTDEKTLLTPLAENLLFGLKPADPMTYIMAATLIGAVAAAAGAIPATRATRVDPMTALRYE